MSFVCVCVCLCVCVCVHQSRSLTIVTSRQGFHFSSFQQCIKASWTCVTDRPGGAEVADRARGCAVRSSEAQTTSHASSELCVFGYSTFFWFYLFSIILRNRFLKSIFVVRNVNPPTQWTVGQKMSPI